MKPGYRRLALLGVAVVTATGLPLLVYRHLLAPPAGDALAHPGESFALHAHILAAPWLLFVLGVLWPVHVLPCLRDRRVRRRPTGVVLAWSVAPLVATGYLTQVIDAAAARGWLAAVHAYGGVAWVALFAAHVVLARRQRRLGGGEPAPQRCSSAPSA